MMEAAFLAVFWSQVVLWSVFLVAWAWEGLK